jgi:parallel beta-helix repeat protein
MKTVVKCLFAIIGVTVFVGIVAMNAQAQPHDEVWVDDDAASEWYDSAHVRTIQEGVDNASDGGTVYVWDGDYDEDVDVNTKLTIKGNTTVDAVNGIYQNRTNITYNEYGFWVMGDYINISGFSMRCVGADLSGVHLDASDYCNISGNVIFEDGSDGVYLDDSCNNTIFNNILRHNFYGVMMDGDSTHNTVEKNNISDGRARRWGSGETYFIYVKEEGGWLLQKEFHFSRYYAAEIAELPLPDVDGEYKIRISQHGGMAAHIDYVALHDENDVSPYYAVCLDNGWNVLDKLKYRDNDVADAFGKTIEVAWDGNIGSSTLILMANEEQPIEMRPLLTPHRMTPELMEDYVLQNNGAIIVDGIPGDIGDADFSSYWMPNSGHPWGTTYLWLRCDGEYLYAIMEVTCDNTYDETGWGSLYVFTGGEVKEFRVNALGNIYGMDGFVYTDKVVWQHIVYEFKIPLEEIGATVGDSIKVGYGCYGTVAAIPSGIYLLGLDSPDWNTIRGNIVYNYGEGIYIIAGHHNEIIANRVFNNEIGIRLESSSDYNSISYNNIHNNEHGIELLSSSNNTIIRNIIENNTIVNTGVRLLDGSNDNEVHFNCFINNLPQARDNGLRNNWDNNFWSDYPVEGGIYDIPVGTTDSQDHYTLRECPKEKRPPTQVSTLIPMGMLLLIGLISLLAVIVIRKKQR